MGLLDSIRGLFGGRAPLIPTEPISYRPIGVVRNHVRESRAVGWEDVRSDIILREDLVDAVEALEGFSHIIVVFHLDRVPDEAHLHKIPVGNDGAERGVFATRSQRRPNGIGVAVVPLIHRRQRALRVLGLDALDGTPVLDLKPYLPAYDAVTGAKLPDWAQARPGE